MSTNARVLTIEGLSKRYSPQRPPILEQLDLQLESGEYLAIMGESGAGKSTLLNLAAGLDRPDSGSIRLDGVELTALDDDALTRLRRARIGFVFQAFHVLPYLSVLQNVALPLDLLGVGEPARSTRAQQALADVGLGEFGERFARELSGGELQRIAIARALVHRPPLVLADEPTGNLDARTATQILQLLRAQLRAAAASAVLITHSQAAAATADRILLLEAGRLRPLAGP